MTEKGKTYFSARRLSRDLFAKKKGEKLFALSNRGGGRSLRTDGGDLQPPHTEGGGTILVLEGKRGGSPRNSYGQTTEAFRSSSAHGEKRKRAGCLSREWKETPKKRSPAQHHGFINTGGRRTGREGRGKKKGREPCGEGEGQGFSTVWE